MKNLKDQPLSGYGLYDTLLMKLKSHPDYLETARTGIDDMQNPVLHFEGAPIDSYWNQAKADIVMPLIAYHAHQLLGHEPVLLKLQFDDPDDANWNISLYDDWIAGEITFAEMVKQARDNWDFRPLAPFVLMEDLEKYHDNADISIPFSTEEAKPEEIKEVWDKVCEMPCVKDTMEYFRQYVYGLPSLDEQLTSTLSIDAQEDSDLNREYLKKVNFPFAEFDEPDLDGALVYGQNLICSHQKSAHDEINLCVKTEGLLSYFERDDNTLEISHIWAKDGDNLTRLMNTLHAISKETLKPVVYRGNPEYLSLGDNGVSLSENHPIPIRIADRLDWSHAAHYVRHLDDPSDTGIRNWIESRILNDAAAVLNGESLKIALSGALGECKNVQDMEALFYAPARENRQTAIKFAKEMVEKYDFVPALKEAAERLSGQVGNGVSEFLLKHSNRAFSHLEQDFKALRNPPSLQQQPNHTAFKPR